MSGDGYRRAKKAAMVVSIALACASCALVREESAGSRFSHRFRDPPEQAARCFARNAEEHSSALAAEVGERDPRGRVQVVVRVKNGVVYARASFVPAGTGSEGTIQLMVLASSGRDEIARVLFEGC